MHDAEEAPLVLVSCLTILMTTVIIGCCLVWAAAGQHIGRVIESLFGR